MSHTDPQNDIPCTACEAEGSRSRLDDDGLCPDCRTPAGRLVAALLAAGIEDVNHDSSITVSVGCLTIEVYEDDPERWTIEGFDADGITAIDAIAAIVQAPGLRTERDRRIDPVEHARAVMETWRGVVDDPPYWPSLHEGWRQSDDRADLLARVGADVLAEVER